ncbi:MAG: SDR family NAD(P)-dependent oxidoreductase, partial [Waterburya sp.]
NTKITPENNKPWLIFTDQQGLSKQIANQLEQAEANYVLVDNFELEANNLNQIFQQSQELQGIIYLTGLDNPSEPNITTINNYQQQHCTNILNLVQALYANSIATPIWLVTRGNQNVTNKLNSDAIASSCLWGLANAIALEHPEYWGGIVDLDSESHHNEVDSLLAVINNENQEDRLVIRQDKTYVPRLELTEDLKPQKALEINSDGSYLITGGWGSLGLKIAQWLAAKGAKNLLLLGRSNPSDDAQQEIKKLEQQGVTVSVIQVNITDYEALKTVFNNQKSIASSTSPTPPVSQSPSYAKRYPLGLPVPLKGIIHAAGVLDDGILQGQTWTRFASVIAPKVTGAWNLHQVTKDLDLDFFVLFSSVASLIGSPGQSNYSVANTGLDAIARYRHSQGLPALSINWGAWGDSGMAVEQGFNIPGLDLINPQMGLKALEQLLTTELTQVGVISADWQKLSQKFPSLQQSNYFARLITKSDNNQQSEANQEIFAELLATSADKRPEYLTQYLQKAIAEILQIEPASLSISHSLLDTGMDSLMVMEAINQLKTDLQLLLYPREFYERPQITSLAAYLATEFAKTHEQKVKTTSKTNNSPKFNPLKDKLAPAAFILSSPRSGSTLLRVMLAGHPSLSSPPELHLLPFDTMVEREAELGVSQLGEGLKRAFMA